MKGSLSFDSLLIITVPALSCRPWSAARLEAKLAGIPHIVALIDDPVTVRGAGKAGYPPRYAGEGGARPPLRFYQMPGIF